MQLFDLKCSDGFGAYLTGGHPRANQVMMSDDKLIKLLGLSDVLNMIGVCWIVMELIDL